MTTDTTTALREWARGMFTTKAATELLIGSFRGRFAAAGNPWVQPCDDDGLWIDFDAIPSQVGALSSEEGPAFDRRVNWRQHPGQSR